MTWGIFEDDAKKYLDSLIFQREVDAQAQSGDPTAMGIVLTAREMAGMHVAPPRKQHKKRQTEKQFGNARKVETDLNTEETTMEKLLKADALGEILGFAPRSIVNMAREKPHLLPPYIRVSDSYRWRPSIVEAWMDSQSQKGQEAEAAATKSTAAQPKRGRGRPRK